MLVALYLTACIYRHRIARHYGQGFRFLGWRDICEGWDCLNFSQNALTWKAIIILWLLLGLSMLVA